MTRLSNIREGRSDGSSSSSEDDHFVRNALAGAEQERSSSAPPPPTTGPLHLADQYNDNGVPATERSPLLGGEIEESDENDTFGHYGQGQNDGNSGHGVPLHELHGQEPPSPQPCHSQRYDSYLGDQTPIISNLSAFLQPDYSWRDVFSNLDRNDDTRKGQRRDRHGNVVVEDTLDHMHQMGLLEPHQQHEHQQRGGDGQRNSNNNDDPNTISAIISSTAASFRPLRRTTSSMRRAKRKDWFLTSVLLISCVTSMYVLTVSGPDHSNGGLGRHFSDNRVVVTDGSSPSQQFRRRRRYDASYYRRYRHKDWRLTDNRSIDGEREAVPTLLGIVEPETYDMVDAISNELYDEMADAEFVTMIGSREAAARMPALRVDRDAITFHHPLTLSWNDGADLTLRDDDVIALYCPATEPDHYKFRDAATIEQIVATGGIVFDDDEVETDDDDYYTDRQKSHKKARESRSSGGGSWKIRHFPIVREKSCEFRLWSRQRQREHSDTRTKDIAAVSTRRDVSKQRRRDEKKYKKEYDDDDKFDIQTTFTLAARTGPISLPRAMEEPTAIHLAISSEPTEMVVSFTTGVAGVPVVQYGPTFDDSFAYDEDFLPFSFQTTGSSITYDATDMCGEPANVTEPGLFVSPGHLHTVRLQGLTVDSDYSYRVGVRTRGGRFHDVYKDLANAMYENGVVWSHVHTFHTAPRIGVTTSPAAMKSARPFSFLVYSDQGSPVFGWEASKMSVEHLVYREVDRPNRGSKDKHEDHPVRFVQHLGGLSRSYGSSQAWDAWFDSITNLTPRIPLMIAVGDTEYDHKTGGENGKDPSGVTTARGYAPSWGRSVFASASGGECGVPTARHFTMPSTGNGVFWYSYSYGSVHTIVISSEHDLSVGSDQHRWLLHQLRGIDRDRTPWVILESHRPMYHSQMRSEELEVAIAMRYELEPLMYDFGVDLYLSGHAQTYLRTCGGLYESKCGVGGPVHIAVGTMGARLNPSPMYKNTWTDSFAEERGYGRLTVHNATALHWEFVANIDGKTLDNVWIYKETK